MTNPPPLPANPAVTARIAMIEGSLRTFWQGLFGLVPLFGYPFAIAACVSAVQSRRFARSHQLWNPAGRYRVAGLVLAIFTLIVQPAIVVIALIAAAA